MADQFDLEQGIMGCWNVTGDLDVLFEELVENEHFTKDDASNFALGLSTIYEAKFAKLFRTFEEFLKTYYIISKELKATQQELSLLRDEMEDIVEANQALCDEVEVPSQTLQEIFEEMEEERLAALERENDVIDLDLIEDEFGFR